VRTVPFFLQDEQTAIVQNRWGYLNRDTNMITRATAIGIDIHFFIEQAAVTRQGFSRISTAAAG